LRGRIEVGGAFQFLNNLLHNPIDILHHIVVPKAQNNGTLITKPGIAIPIVIRPLSMLSTVQLDNQSFLQTHKIDVARQFSS
jgi:hypothetical protein